MRSLCISCGRQHNHPTGRPRLFGCGCCAFAWQGSKPTKGQLAVHKPTGKVSRVVRIQKGLVTFETSAIYSLQDVSGVVPIAVTHDSNCPHNPLNRSLQALRCRKEQNVSPGV